MLQQNNEKPKNFTENIWSGIHRYSSMFAQSLREKIWNTYQWFSLLQSHLALCSCWHSSTRREERPLRFCLTSKFVLQNKTTNRIMRKLISALFFFEVKIPLLQGIDSFHLTSSFFAVAAFIGATFYLSLLSLVRRVVFVIIAGRGAPRDSTCLAVVVAAFTVYDSFKPSKSLAIIRNGWRGKLSGPSEGGGTTSTRTTAFSYRLQKKKKLTKRT